MCRMYLSLILSAGVVAMIQNLNPLNGEALGHEAAKAIKGSA